MFSQYMFCFIIYHHLVFMCFLFIFQTFVVLFDLWGVYFTYSSQDGGVTGIKVSKDPIIQKIGSLLCFNMALVHLLSLGAFLQVEGQS